MIHGSYTQTGARSVLHVRVDGSRPETGHGCLVADGQVTLDGTLRIDKRSFVPTVGEQIDISLMRGRNGRKRATGETAKP